MMPLQPAFLFLILVVAVTSQPNNNITKDSSEPPTKESMSSSSSLSAKRAACFQTANLTQHPSNSFTVDSFSYSSSSSSGIACSSSSLLVHYTLVEFWIQHASPFMCREREAYGEVMGCLLDAAKSCRPQRKRIHFPDREMVKRGIHYICDVAEDEQFDVNITCARSHFQKVYDCIHGDVQLLVGNSVLPDPFPKYLMCRTYDIADLCNWEVLQICGEETAAAYTRMMSLYIRPPSCSSSTSVLTVTSVYLVVLLVLCFVVNGVETGY